ncbi:MAG: ATP-binding protein [Lachnospiraceae bacterium]|nr:ATP-binding protein [Lachnospiraceae bacterium]
MVQSFLTEMLAAIIVFLIPMNKKRWSGLKFIVVSALAYFVIANYSINWWVYKDSYKSILELVTGILPTVSYYGIHIVFLMIAIYLTVETDIMETIYIVSIAYASEHIAYCMRLLIEYNTSNQIDNKSPIVYVLAHGVVCVASYYLLAKPMTKDGHYRIDAITSIWTGVFVIFLVLVLSLISFVEGFQYIHAVYASMACFLLLSMQRGQVIARLEEEEFAFREKLWNQKKMQYELSKDAMAVVNRNYHDIKHQIAAVNAMTDEERRQEALQRMEENIGIYDSVVHTENELLDTVLTEKRLACGRKKITMSCICEGKSMLFMDGLDLYTLLGNALDNAIEAAEKVPESERYISVLIQKKLGMTIVEIRNPIAAAPTIKDGNLFTTKKDKDSHGYGVNSMKEIVKKYDGIFEYKANDKTFVVRMIFQK